MKFETNFISSSCHWLSYLGCTFLVVIVFLLIYISGLLYQGSILQNKAVDFKQQEYKLQQHIQQKQAEIYQYLNEDELQKLRQNITAINSVSDFNSRDVFTVLNAMEKLLPEKTYLERFSYDAEKSESVIFVQSSTPDMITQFVDRLQAESLYNQVSLTNQKQQKQAGALAILSQINIQHKTRIKRQ